jgi:hypothetical protein
MIAAFLPEIRPGKARREERGLVIPTALAHQKNGRRRDGHTCVNRPWYCFNLMMADIMATESTEKHGKK